MSALLNMRHRGACLKMPDESCRVGIFFACNRHSVAYPTAKTRGIRNWRLHVKILSAQPRARCCRGLPPTGLQRHQVTIKDFEDAMHIRFSIIFIYPARGPLGMDKWHNRQRTISVALITPSFFPVRG